MWFHKLIMAVAFEIWLIHADGLEKAIKKSEKGEILSGVFPFPIHKSPFPMKLLNSLLGRHPENIHANVEIYTWQTCPFCIRAKLLLWWKGVNYTEYKIDGDETARAAMAERSQGRRSVPQIFINDQYIGGCDDIYALDAQGQLDPMLQST